MRHVGTSMMVARAAVCVFVVSLAVSPACGSVGSPSVDASSSARDAELALDASTPRDATAASDSAASRDAAAARDAAMRSDAGGPDGGSPVPGGGTRDYGHCSKPCDTPADCCPAGAEGCPGPSYPNNYACLGGACRSAVCSTTADCAHDGARLDCLSISGAPLCARPCADDTACVLPQTCSGTTDDGRRFCLARSTTGGCTDDASCHGFGRCVDRLCVCTSGLDCTRAGFSACAR